jgi:hypothetical protein
MLTSKESIINLTIAEKPRLQLHISLEISQQMRNQARVLPTIHSCAVGI